MALSSRALTSPLHFLIISKTITVTLEENSITGSINQIFCDEAGEFQSLNVERFPSLAYVDADCEGVSPEVTCDCCTTCYSDT